MSESKVGEVQVFNFDNMIVRVHRPSLTDEERARRMKSIQKAAERLLLEAFKQKGV